MLPDHVGLTKLVSLECGLALEARLARQSDGNPIVEFFPAGFDTRQTFCLVMTPGWRSLQLEFRLGKFASELVSEMGKSTSAARQLFASVTQKCLDDDSSIILKINDITHDPLTPDRWPAEWKDFSFTIHKGQLALNTENHHKDFDLMLLWASRSMAAIVSLLPVESTEFPENMPDDQLAGFLEGGKTTVEVNRYERDRRNRAAAIAIHGYCCQACSTDLEKLYGDIGRGYIEVHHVTPVSKLGNGYVLDPLKDLAPLCPNCHRMAHRKNPPYSIQELREIVNSPKS